MQTFINVHVVDDAGKVGSGIFERLVGRQVDGLDLQRLPEAFCLGVVVKDSRGDSSIPPGRGRLVTQIHLRRILAELKWSSQHLEGGSCDDEAQAAFGSVRSLRAAARGGRP